MPLYEYQCAKDGRFELIRRFSDPPLKKCPTCGGRVEKLASAPAIQFKGSGWYVTDYAKKSGGDGKTEPKNGDKKASSDASPKSEPSSKAETSSKAEPKSDSTPMKPPSKDGSASGSSQTSKASS